jgi:hypothetical protein
MKEANNTEKTFIEVSTSLSYTTQFLVYTFVNNKIADVGFRIDITVCGLEKLVAK